MATNLNMVRTIRPISRSVEFETNEQAARFVNLYSDLFYKAKGTSREKTGFGVTHFGNLHTTVYFTIKKSDWEMIEKDLKLKLVKDGWYQRNHYRYED